MENDIKLVPYEAIYKKSVLKCLRRNFNKLNKMNDNELEDWFEPLVTYSWENNIDIPFRYGIVLLNENDVVGYCGNIVSIVKKNNCNYKYANVTTWCIDLKYRFYTYTVLNELMKHVDIISDFTPSKVIEKINGKIYGFKYIDEFAYKFGHCMNADLNGIKLKRIESQDEISDFYIKTLFTDHITFGCNCIEYMTDDSEKHNYFFYYLPHNNEEWINIVYVSDLNLFSKYICVISKYIYITLKRKILADNSFIIKEQLGDIEYTISARSRMVWYSNQIIDIPGLLYSELPLLKY